MSFVLLCSGLPSTVWAGRDDTSCRRQVPWDIPCQDSSEGQVSEGRLYVAKHTPDAALQGQLDVGAPANGLRTTTRWERKDSWCAQQSFCLFMARVHEFRLGHWQLAATWTFLNQYEQQNQHDNFSAWLGIIAHSQVVKRTIINTSERVWGQSCQWKFVFSRPVYPSTELSKFENRRFGRPRHVIYSLISGTIYQN